MTHHVSFTRFVYPDTNILGMLASDVALHRSLRDFLYSHDLCLAVSLIHGSELSEAKDLHVGLNKLLTTVPSALVKPPWVILDEEVNSYPERRADTLALYTFESPLRRADFSRFLSSDELAESRKEQRLAAEQMPQRFDALKANFPPSESGRYTWEQADDFAWTITVQWLSDTHVPFLGRFADNAADLNADVFLSVQLFGYALFYKYYLHGKQPQVTDFADMQHLACIPYCQLAILERDMCNVLNHIKSRHRVLDGVAVKNIDFLRDWTWHEE